MSAMIDITKAMEARIAEKKAKTKSPKSPKSDSMEEAEWIKGDNADFGSESAPTYTPFPLRCLPGVAGIMARESAAAAMVPETLTGMTVLGILSASIGAGLEVASGGDRTTRGNLFLMPVAQSGTGKGQSFGTIAAPFMEREAERVEEWKRTDRPQANADKKVAEARLAQLEANAKRGLSSEGKASLLQEWREIEAEIDRAERCLKEPAWSTEQATKEAIESLFSTANREQVASLSAEARGAVDVLMGRYRQSTDEGIFLAGYSGDPVKVDRKGSGRMVLNRPCLALLWMLQPDKLREMLENPAMTESGLLPRFLLADTKAEPEEEPEERQRVSLSTREAWRNLIDALLDEYHEPNVQARVIETERPASVLMREYYNEIVHRRKGNGDLEDVSIYAARWAENAWRLAVVLHAAEHGEDAWRHSLAAGTAANAVELMRWFSEQQLSVLAAGREDRLMKRFQRLKEVLATKPDKSERLRELEKRHSLKANEVRKLATKFPSILKIETISNVGAGRPSVVAKLMPANC